MQFHPLAEVFPPMNDAEFEALKADIEAHGVRQPAWTYEKKIIDGRHRWLACEALKKKCPVKEFKGNNPLAFVISMNVRLRKLTPSQLAFAALEIEKAEAGRAKVRQIAGGKNKVPEIIPEAGESREKAAAAVGINSHYVSDAKRIREKAPEIAERVWRGELTITQAKREMKEQERESRRGENLRLVESSESPDDACGSAKFATIVIDPPWDWGDEGDQDQLGRARPTYQTMSFEDLLALSVGARADDDCHIYLWITNRSLPKGFALLEEWGFRYVTALTWCKPSIGMGNYFRGSTEHVLFGVKGSQGLNRKDVGTWFQAPRGQLGHSSKPDEFYSLVESCSPGPYLEMFARSNRKGWTPWGAETNVA
jgi:N6-adenosine-specific RNA methylase IME4